MTADLSESILRDILAEVRGLRADSRRRAAAAPLADRLLEAIYGLLEGETFTAPGLVARAVSPLSTRVELRAVLDDIARCDLAAPGVARRIGKFLNSNIQHYADGKRLVYVGKSRSGKTYKVAIETETRSRWNLP